jgi:cytochrome c oxidase subunit 3
MAVVTQNKTSGSIAPPRWPTLYGGGGRSGDSGSSFPISSRHLAIWILLTAVTMMFAGLSSAYIVLRGVPTWQNITVPALVWANTLVLLASSVAIEFARGAVKRDQQSAVKQWLVVSGVLGFAFLAGQLVVWRQLTSAGVYLATNLHSSFFYVLTGAHGLHLAGGLIGLCVVLRRALGAQLTATDHEPLKVWALYWHYMDVVWVYLFLLLLLA